ncbi:MAG: type IV pilus assembly protein PilM [Candidatus Omnitrophota bacterium]
MSKWLDKYLSGIKKLLPEKSSESSVGLDIGVDSCKMVEIVKSGNSFELINWAIEPIVNNDKKAVIKRIMSKLKNPSRAPFTGVFGKGTLIRYIDMPKMSIEDLRKSLSFESDKYFPFAKDQIYTDCYIQGTNERENKVSVLVAAAKKEIIDERVRLLIDLGLQSEFIGVNPIALANVFHSLGHCDQSQKEAVTGKVDPSAALAVLDMGETVSNLMILQNNMPRFTRDIYIGGKELSQRISNALGVSLEEAERIKRNPAGKKEEILNTSESSLLNLIAEIRLSFDYFTTEHNCHITKMFLTGGSSMLEGIIEFFNKNLEITAEKWDPLACLKLSSAVPLSAVKNDAGRLGVALGLALYQYR